MSFEVEAQIELEVRRLGNPLVVGHFGTAMFFDRADSEIVVAES